MHGIPDSLGTAVNIVTMVYGNMGEDCGTGVAFTRDCRTGENVLNGDVLTNAQGEDVVSGARTPEPIEKMKKGKTAKIYKELETLAVKLEKHFKDVQDVEFTFEHGELYMLQTRRAQRAGGAAVRIAVEMVDEGLISEEEAVQRIPPQDLDQLFHPMVDPRASVTVLAKGLPASPGAATGEAVFDADDAEAMKKKGHDVILVRPETSPEDFHGIVAARAILTARGGIDVDVLRADDARLPHAAAHDRRVARHPATRRENGARRDDAVEVFGRGLGPHQDDVVSLLL